MSWTLTLSQAAIDLAGPGANTAVSLSGALLARFSDDEEGALAIRTGVDWIDKYSSVGTNWKKGLSYVVSRGIAQNIVAADMSGYSSAAEAQTMLNLLTDQKEKVIAALSSGDVKKKMGV